MSTNAVFLQHKPDDLDEERLERIDGLWSVRPVPVKLHSQLQWALTSLLRASKTAWG